MIQHIPTKKHGRQEDAKGGMHSWRAIERKFLWLSAGYIPAKGLVLGGLGSGVLQTVTNCQLDSQDLCKTFAASLNVTLIKYVKETNKFLTDFFLQRKGNKETLSSCFNGFFNFITSFSLFIVTL